MPNVVRCSTDRGLNGVPAVVATEYSGAAQLRADSTTRNGRLNIAWFDAGGAFLSRTSGSWGSVTSAAWIGVNVIAAAAPANTVYMALEIEFDALLGEEFYADRLVLSTGDNPAWAPGGFSSNARFILERSVDNGVSWSEVPGATRESPAPVDAGSGVAQATILDFQVPLRDPVLYRGVSQTGDTTSVNSPVGISGEATNLADDWWLRDPSDSTKDLAVKVMSLDRVTTPGHAGTTFHPDGREFPVVIFGNMPVKERFDLSVRTLNKDDYLAVMSLLKSRKTLTIQNVQGEVWWVRVTGDVSHNLVRSSPTLSETYRLRHHYEISCEVTEVASQ